MYNEGGMLDGPPDGPDPPLAASKVHFQPKSQFGPSVLSVKESDDGPTWAHRQFYAHARQGVKDIMSPHTSAPPLSPTHR